MVVEPRHDLLPGGLARGTGGRPQAAGRLGAAGRQRRGAGGRPHRLGDPPAGARDDPDDVAGALWATVELFERVERQCAERAGLPLTVAHRRLRQRVAEILRPLA